jgi:hypothetical protein
VLIFLKNKAFKRVILASVVLVYGYLNITGFCFLQWRYISDNELIYRKLQRATLNKEINIPDANPKTIKKYMADNPNNCTVILINDWIVSRFIFGNRRGVSCVYEMSASYRGDTRDRYFENYSECTPCGYTKDGFRTTTNIQPAKK